MRILKIIILSFVLSFISIYVLNHFGKFSFLYDYNAPPSRSNEKLNMVAYIPANTKISLFYFNSFFGNRTTFLRIRPF